MVQSIASKFQLLLNKDIYAILDGDTILGNYVFTDDYSTNQVHMPYLSGPELCSISTLFGLPVTYPRNGNALSRWQYLENIFKHCIKENRCSELLSYLFNIQQFSEMFSGHNANMISEAHEYYVDEIIGRINGILLFAGHKLTCVDNQFIIKDIGSTIELNSPQIKCIDREYIKSISVRAFNDIDNNNYDSAITKARTLLEEVFCYVIEKKNEIPSDSGNIKTLYNQVKDLYNMHGESTIDRRINMLLSGLEKIVTAISEMRNIGSDSHGVGSNRINIDSYHARLLVNSSVAMAEFILSVESNANSD